MALLPLHAVPLCLPVYIIRPVLCLEVSLVFVALVLVYGKVKDRAAIFSCLYLVSCVQPEDFMKSVNVLYFPVEGYIEFSSVVSKMEWMPALPVLCHIGGQRVRHETQDSF